jgi:ubiquinone/menaquinone biosynthesis C-methylase UbiE
MDMDIKDYWNDRAAADKANATTNDIFMRELERATLIANLRRLGCHSESHVLDVGCGDGSTIFALDEAFGCVLSGTDYSTSMIDLARQTLVERPNRRIDFTVADAREIGMAFASQSFDFVSTDRCLINLQTSQDQFAAIGALAGLLRPGGAYLAIENFVEGNDRLNELRSLYGLSPIEIRWHNRFFRESEFVACSKRYFRTLEKIDFSSSYYFATRVIYAALCAIEGELPDYRHPIHMRSTKLPSFGDFSPIKLFVLRK